MIANISLILWPVGLRDTSDAMVELFFVGPLMYVPKISDINIEFHCGVWENYFQASYIPKMSCVVEPPPHHECHNSDHGHHPPPPYEASKAVGANVTDVMTTTTTHQSCSRMRNSSWEGVRKEEVDMRSLHLT
jgi:hypothetical protein